MSKHLIRSLVAIIALVACAQVAANTYCVQDGPALASTLVAVASDPDQAAVIRLVAGTYSGTFTYVAASSFDPTPSISISGGWSPSCVDQSAAQSRIEGDLILTGNYAAFPTQVSKLSIGGNFVTRTSAPVSVLMTNIDGNLDIGCCAQGLRLQRTIVNGEDVSIVTSSTFSGYSSSLVRNNLFGGNLTDFDWFELSTAGSLMFLGNTAHLSSSMISSFRLNISNDDALYVVVSRNLVTSDDDHGFITMDLDGNDNYVSGSRVVRDNWLDASGGNLTVTEGVFDTNGNVAGNFALPYVRTAPPYDFHLLLNSPQIDYSSPTPGDFYDVDLDGHPRVMNDMVDVGSYEIFVDSIFHDGFDAGTE